MYSDVYNIYNNIKLALSFNTRVQAWYSGPKKCSGILEHNFFGQRSKSSSKALFKYNFFS